MLTHSSLGNSPHCPRTHLLGLLPLSLLLCHSITLLDLFGMGAKQQCFRWPKFHWGLYKTLMDITGTSAPRESRVEFFPRHSLESVFYLTTRVSSPTTLLLVVPNPFFPSPHKPFLCFPLLFINPHRTRSLEYIYFSSSSLILSTPPPQWDRESIFHSSPLPNPRFCQNNFLIIETIFALYPLWFKSPHVFVYWLHIF